jgi:phosphoglycerate dehydrogenase-like enzyme
MIHRTIDYYIKCDNCLEPLIYGDDHVLTSHIGHIMKEGNTEHIIEVAESYGWVLKNNKHICVDCKK